MGEYEQYRTRTRAADSSRRQSPHDNRATCTKDTTPTGGRMRLRHGGLTPAMSSNDERAGRLGQWRGHTRPNLECSIIAEVGRAPIIPASEAEGLRLYLNPPIAQLEPDLGTILERPR